MIRSIFKRQISGKCKIPNFIRNKSKNEFFTRNILQKIMNLLSENQDLELIFDQFIIEIWNTQKKFHLKVLNREILYPDLNSSMSIFNYEYENINSLYTSLYHIISKYGLPDMIFSSCVSILEENQETNFNFDINIDLNFDLYADFETPHPVLLPLPTSQKKKLHLQSFDENNNMLFLYLENFKCKG
jgi:hypothetical protein